MKGETLLTRINMSSPSTEPVATGFGSVTRQDIMAALGMGNLHPRYYLMGMVYFVEDKSCEHELYLHARFASREVASRHYWKKRKGFSDAYLLGAATGSLRECLSSFRCRCRGCGGGGVRAVDQKPSKIEGIDKDTCPVCFGTGMQPWSHSKRGKESCIPKITYWRSYRDVYDTLYGEWVQWRIIVERHVVKYMGFDE